MNVQSRGAAPKEDGPNDYGYRATSPAQTTSEVQADLFADYARKLAERARDTGIDVAERWDPDWADNALAWIANLEAGVEITADDLRSALGASRAVGSVFRKAAKLGLITFVGFATSTAATRHGAPTRLWRVT